MEFVEYYLRCCMKLKWFRKLWKNAKMKLFRYRDDVFYRIIEIDTSAQEVTFHIKNKAASLKCKFSEAINEAEIIQGLDSLDACWLGGYFGRALRASLEGRELLKRAKRMSFLLVHKKGRYKIIYQNRSGEIGYIDQNTRKEFVEYPLTVANNDYIISAFDSNQACYIGILAGISMEKAISHDEKTGKHNLEDMLQKRPKLRLIK